MAKILLAACLFAKNREKLRKIVKKVREFKPLPEFS